MLHFTVGLLCLTAINLQRVKAREIILQLWKGYLNTLSEITILRPQGKAQFMKMNYMSKTTHF